MTGFILGVLATLTVLAVLTFIVPALNAAFINTLARHRATRGFYLAALSLWLERMRYKSPMNGAGGNRKERRRAARLLSKHLTGTL